MLAYTSADLAWELNTLDIDLNHFGEITKHEDDSSITYSTDRIDFGVHACSADLMYEQVSAHFNEKANAYGATSWCRTERYVPVAGSLKALHKYTYTPTIAKLLFAKLEEKAKQQLGKETVEKEHSAVE